MQVLCRTFSHAFIPCQLCTKKIFKISGIFRVLIEYAAQAFFVRFVRPVITLRQLFFKFGRQIVEGYGGKVLTMDLAEGLSTTRIIERIHGNDIADADNTT